MGKEKTFRQRTVRAYGKKSLHRWSLMGSDLLRWSKSLRHPFRPLQTQWRRYSKPELAESWKFRSAGAKRDQETKGKAIKASVNVMFDKQIEGYAPKLKQPAA